MRALYLLAGASLGACAPSASTSPTAAPTVLAVDFEVSDPDADPNGTLLVRYAPGARPAGPLDVVDDAGEVRWLNDEGRDGDARRGDGTWSGPAWVDLNRTFQRYADLQVRTEDALRRTGKLRLGWFDGRRRIATAPVNFGPVKLGPVDGVAGAHDGLPIGVPVPPPSRADLAGASIPLFPLVGTPTVTRPDHPEQVVATFGAVATVLSDHSLVVVAPEVVENSAYTWNPCSRTGASDGAWSFRHVMEGLANEASTGVSAAQMGQQLVTQWSSTVEVNGQEIPGATTQNAARGVAVGTTLLDYPAVRAWRNAGWDLDQAPFRLYAITYRPDLVAFSGESDAGASEVSAGGEIRLLFQVVQPTATGTCQGLQSYLIFEYALPQDTCDEVQAYAADWLALSQSSSFDAAFSASLAALTEVAVGPGAAPGRPNDSALGQLRINDFQFSSVAVTSGTGRDWVLRELRLNQGDGPYLLGSETVKGTPRFDLYPDGPEGWLSGEVPLADEDAAAFIPYTRTDYWGTNETVADLGLSAEDRLARSVSTCNGCHARDTAVFTESSTSGGFLHIRPRRAGQAAVLSQFLTGEYPAGSELPEGCADTPDICFEPTFADLERRGQILEELTTMSCAAAVAIEGTSESE